MSVALKMIGIALLDATDVLGALLGVLYLAGLWKLLEKSGVKGWWALIPGARDYQLARCAGREPEGRVFSVSGVVMLVIELLFVLLGNSKAATIEEIANQVLVLTVLLIAVLFVRWIYMLRVFAGLLNVYNLRKRWLWLVLASYTRWLPMLLWGFG